MGSHEYHIKRSIGVGPCLWDPLVPSYAIAPRMPDSTLEWPAKAQLKFQPHTIVCDDGVPSFR